MELFFAIGLIIIAIACVILVAVRMREGKGLDNAFTWVLIVITVISAVLAVLLV